MQRVHHKYRINIFEKTECCYLLSERLGESMWPGGNIMYVLVGWPMNAYPYFIFPTKKIFIKEIFPTDCTSDGTLS